MRDRIVNPDLQAFLKVMDRYYRRRGWNVETGAPLPETLHQLGLDVVIGTHPIPQNYYLTHQALGTWQSTGWQERIQHVVTDEETRLAYD